MFVFWPNYMYTGLTKLCSMALWLTTAVCTGLGAVFKIIPAAEI